MPWDRPKTIKLYLQPPACDRLVTVWPDLKIVDQAATAPPGEPQDCFGVHLLFGSQAQAVPWEETRFHVRGDGIPIHCLRTEWQDFRLELEVFCAWKSDAVPSGLSSGEEGTGSEASPTTLTYARLTVTNQTAQARDFLLSLLPRTGPAHYLWGIRADFYASYQPQQATWDMVRNTWAVSSLSQAEGAGAEACLRDGLRTLRLSAPEGAEFSWRERSRSGHAAHYFLELSTPLDPAQSRVFHLVLGHGETSPVNAEEYETRRAETIAAWQEQLRLVRVQPRSGDGEIREIYWSLLCQCLQMLSRDHEGLLRPRQGGGCPFVWPWEAVEFLRALDRAGLGVWTRPAYEFFRHHQTREGDDRGRYASVGAANWYAHTGAVLWGLAAHLLAGNSAERFAAWRESVLLAVDWVERQRALTRAASAGLGQGLLPAGTGHDWDVSAQYWCFTDAYTYMGLRDMAQAFAHFDEPEALRLQEAAADYEQCLRRTLDQVCAGQEGREELYIPNLLGVEESYPPPGPYFADGPVNLMRAGILDPRSALFERVEKYFRNRGWIHNGLTGLMTDGLFSWGQFYSDPWAGHTWYLSTSDLCWFYAWLERGERTKAAQTLRAQFRYGMTPEYYMAERYADNDPTFCPWQPNASANGRTITMMLDFYGEEDT